MTRGGRESRAQARGGRHAGDRQPCERCRWRFQPCVQCPSGPTRKRGPRRQVFPVPRRGSPLHRLHHEAGRGIHDLACEAPRATWTSRLPWLGLRPPTLSADWCSPLTALTRPRAVALGEVVGHAGDAVALALRGPDLLVVRQDAELRRAHDESALAVIVGRELVQLAQEVVVLPGPLALAVALSSATAPARPADGRSHRVAPAAPAGPRPPRGGRSGIAGA